MLPGTGVLTTEIELLEAAAEIGFPVILKASAGGGGRGMKIVRDEGAPRGPRATGPGTRRSPRSATATCTSSATSSPRHIEIQVVADKHGTYIAPGRARVLDPAPPPEGDRGGAERGALPELARRCARRRSRRSRRSATTASAPWSTCSTTDGSFYFMEMNTRLQVEHPVTELVTGLDLVREQIKIAAGEPLSFDHTEARKPRGHAIELRINAEDPNNFAPWPGKITAVHMPGGLGVRIDTHVYAGYVVPPNYDSLLAKVIVHDIDRPSAIRRARRCLDEMVIEGIRTNIPFLRRIINNPDFIKGDFDTGFVGRLLSERASAA
jgi:acetyl-CoA carboxylase biotin carboxylase subunit